MTDPTPFSSLGLSEALLKALKKVGYETPSPIQAQSIPHLLSGRDILGQAQTGTGKTAAFALPILQQINLRSKKPQALVLAPTRELAIQVAEAFQSYSHYMSGFHILPIYGGQGYEGQIRGLKRGVQIVVGTPGRIMDHMRKGTLQLDHIRHLVLDEADEMLRMGFIDDVEWILGQTPEDRQIALFSATMPKQIAKVANTYLNDPQHIQIEVKTTTAETIRQRYWSVGGLHKLDATTRILEAERFDAMIIFVRTKTATVELAEKLEARGFSSAALNGDISQQLRERTVEKLKKGQIDILVATDVAARGLDVERISHVLNYDIPYDTEAYVHRIGRTGRAGRSGEAILFVARREMRMLRAIEKSTGQSIEPMNLPTAADINAQRITRFNEKLTQVIDAEDLSFYHQLISDFHQATDVDLVTTAAALAKMAQGDQPFLLSEKASKKPKSQATEERNKNYPVEMESFRIEVGRNDGVSPGNIVGAIANEAGIESQYIGEIKIFDEYCTVDLPTGMPKSTFNLLKNTRVCQKPLKISRLASKSPPPNPKKPKGRSTSGGSSKPKQKQRASNKKRRKQDTAK